MPDPRTHQSVAQRLELQLERYANPLHRRRRWFTWAAGVISLLLVGFFVARGDQTIFLAQPVSESHRHLQEDCQQCHRTHWKPLVRLARADSTIRSVTDHDCRHCHDQHKTDHSPFATGVSDCAECHLEHRGAIRLTDNADASCVRCHKPFADHPQFALLRTWSDEPATASAQATLQQLTQVARREQGTGKWLDKTRLKFSHQEHLAPLQPRWQPGMETANPPQTTQLTCANCHQADANGEYMRPIVYEQHCADCHPLSFVSKLQTSDPSVATEQRLRLPHESPEIVRSVMRQRLIENRQRDSDDGGAPDTATTTRMPNRPPPAEDLIEQELGRLESALFRTPIPAGGDVHPSNVCLKCHESRVVEPGVDAPFAIAPPAIPNRWFPNSRFRHDRHMKMKCLDCHPATGGTMGRAVSDILMPSQTLCHQCHGATSGTHENFRRARSNCTECHQYHHVHLGKAFDGSQTK